ncbi:MAG: protein phosphatase CheZ, partial [Cellvibrionaceae bacterium]|nr:protein phosphatase CheZ [Cellvibrionaceae bacterium]
MNTQYIASQSESFTVELRECAKLLIDKLQSDNYEEASELIHTLVEARDRHLFQSVGRLTRGLHNAIVNFHVDESEHSQPAPLDGTEIQDASDRLHYVIKMTQQAADKTMD